MSDQQPSPPPPKPKPGSLRDRIAAFEKSATPAAATGQSAPAPRPKPSGFATWKPKVPSPPSSPSSKSVDNAAPSSSLKATGTMSASDAKESITKGGGGSLKDRMAALQGKGAFGAPAPPLAPKPAADKPRWKPPPAVPAVDNDGHHEGAINESPAAAIATALDRNKSPPVSVKSRESLDLPNITEGEETSAAEPTTCAEGDADPEEEERQRRAAIAARMARLGGARLGMSPPVLAKKPPMPVRKSTREDVPKQEDREEVLKRGSLSLEERGKNVEGKVSSPPVDEDATVASQPSLTDVQSQSNIDLSPEYLPVRKNSENASLLSVDSADSDLARSSLSMPVPTVPRRAGPPRKKPVKPSAPPTPLVIAAPVIAAPVIATPVIATPVIATPPVIPSVDPIEQKAVETVEEKAIKVPEHEDVGHEEIDNRQIHDEPQSIDLAVQHMPAVGLVAESEEASSGESKEQKFTNDVQSSPLATIEASNESKQQHSHDRDHEHQHVDHQAEDDIINYSDGHLQDYEENHAAEHQEHHPGVQPEDDGNYSEDDIIDHSDEYSQDEENHAAEHHEHQHLQQDDHDDHYHPGIDVAAEPQPSSVVDVAVTEEEGEEARRKRVAERLAKMGGINPFAAPVLSPPLRRSSEDTGYTSLSPVVSSYAHASSPTAALPASPPRPDVPSRKASLRSYEVAEPHPLPVVGSKVEEEQKEVDYSDEFADEEGSSDEVSVYEAEESLSPAHERSLQQAGTAPVCQLPDPILRPPISSSARPHVQMRQYGRHDEEEDDDSHPARRQLPPPSRLPGPPPLEAPPLPPTRPAQPPRRIVPQAPEGKERKEVGEEEGEEAGTNDDEEHEGLVPSHLFVRPPAQLGGGAVSRYPVRGGQRYETVEDDDGDGSENDTPALPKLQRKLEEVPPGRSLPPLPPPPASRHRHLAASPTNMSDPDSDHDGQVLPVRPRHPAVPAPPTVVPVVVPSRRSVPSIPADEEPFSSSYGLPSVAVSEHESEEILDEEEGDPIDPAFHSPSRRGSMTNMHNPVHGDTLGLPVQIPLPPVPANVEKREEAQQQQDQDQIKRQTIAERMAKLGGIKFGASPIPAAISRPPPPRVPQEEVEEDHHPEHHAQADAEDVAQPVEISEEEAERARKERIAAKLAGMGGMRIGMLPRGVGSPSPQRTHVLRDENVPPPSPTRALPPALPRGVGSPSPQRTHVLRDENVPPPSPTRALPPARPPPPPTRPQTQDTDSERDDGVQVEAEESEIEEVDYEDAAEAPVETPPPPLPPVPSTGRIAYHRESTDKTSFSPPAPPALIPGSRPPVPVALPTRRSSVQASKSTGSVDFGFSPSRSTSSHVIHPQSDYVMVEEPQSIEEPISPSRRTSRMAPVRSDPNSISSQWELPSIPSAALDFGSGGDLSLSSWTDAGEPTSPTPHPPLPSKRQSVLKPKTMSSSELQLSADDLMRMWGRVGVQVCEVATSLFETSKKTLIGDGTYAGFIAAVLAGVPNAAPISIASGEYGYLIYTQNGSSVQKRVSDILPGDIVEIYEGKLKGHKGIQTYHQNVGGSGEVLLGVVGEFEAKKSKIRLFHANQHVGQQTVESVSYRLEDLKSGTVKVYRVLELEA